MDDSSEVIDLTESFTFIPTPRCLTNTVIELNDSTTSIETNIASSSRSRGTKRKPLPITIQDKDDVIILQSPLQSEKVSKKKRQARSTLEAIASTKERSPIRESPYGNCPICFDTLGQNPLASTKCGHVFCLSCLESSVKRLKKCPTCRRSLAGKTAYHRLYFGKN